MCALCQRLGELNIDGQNVCKTLELPDNGNQPNISCIPAGDYECELVYSPRFKKYLYEVKDVNGRTKILIHTGNVPSDTQGCILVGMSADVKKNRINESKKAYEKLKKQLKECKKFKLKIKDKTKPAAPAAPATTTPAG